MQVNKALSLLDIELSDRWRLNASETYRKYDAYKLFLTTELCLKSLEHHTFVIYIYCEGWLDTWLLFEAKENRLKFN